jgi:hypothetical protein
VSGEDHRRADLGCSAFLTRNVRLAQTKSLHIQNDGCRRQTPYFRSHVFSFPGGQRAKEGRRDGSACVQDVPACANSLL